MTFSRVSASTSSREPVMFQYVPPGPREESLQLDSGHHHAPRMANGTPSTLLQQPASWLNHKHRGVELNRNETHEEKERDNGLAQILVSAQVTPPITKDFLTQSTAKRKHDEISSRYFIPQRDGADDEVFTSMGESSQIVDSEAVTSWAAERRVRRDEDSRLLEQHRQSADAAIERLIHVPSL